MSRAVFSQEAQVVSLLLGAFAPADDESSAGKIVTGRKAGGLDVSSRLFISSNLLHGYCCKTTLTFYKTGYPNDANYCTNCCSGRLFLILYPVFTSPLNDRLIYTGYTYILHYPYYCNYRSCPGGAGQISALIGCLTISLKKSLQGESTFVESLQALPIAAWYEKEMFS